jgi:hypothetical protein
MPAISGIQERKPEKNNSPVKFCLRFQKPGAQFLYRGCIDTVQGITLEFRLPACSLHPDPALSINKIDKEGK